MSAGVTLTYGWINILGVNDILLIIEGDHDPPLLLDKIVRVLCDAEHGDPPVLRRVELSQVVQLVLSLREPEEAAVSLGAGLLQLVHDGPVPGPGPLPQHVLPRALPEPEHRVHGQLHRLVGLYPHGADECAVS